MGVCISVCRFFFSFLPLSLQISPFNLLSFSFFHLSSPNFFMRREIVSPTHLLTISLLTFSISLLSFSLCVGEFVYGLKEGKDGKMTYSDGSEYVGGWKANKKEGTEGLCEIVIPSQCGFI
jgi:hypothetical protein